MKLIGKRIYIKILAPEDVTEAYVEWINDPEINQYLESRWGVHTLDSVRSYVQSMNDSPHSYLFGIFLCDELRHIGNIKLGGIDFIHRFADIGLLIGDKYSWGKGFASEAISLVSSFAFIHLNLNKVIASMYSNNIGSYKAFLKAGFVHVGTLKKHRFCEGKYVDQFICEYFNTNENGGE